LEIKQTETFAKWFRGLQNRSARVSITQRIARAASGLLGDVKPVGESVSEIRIHVGPGYRVYFQQRGNALIILLCGGDKSSQASKGAQSGDIDKAKALAKNWSGDDD
jgi:putative addiction module killer protein